MSYQSGYILRMIEQFAQAIATLRNRLLGGGPDREPLVGEVRAIADRADIGLDLARTVDTETFRRLISVGGGLDRGRCRLTAELLILEALEARQGGDPDRRRPPPPGHSSCTRGFPRTGVRSPTSRRCSSRVAEATALLAE